MKKILIIIILSLIFTYLPIKFASASVNFNNIEAYEMLNGSAKLKWSTNLNTKAEIHYGLDQNNLDRFMGYSLYDRWHETVLTGLEKDKTYYYKIYAIEESGVTTESFIRNFSTKDMEDTIQPDFEDNEILQTTHDAVAFKWITNEETKATIYYGTDPDNLNKTKGYGTYAKLHIKFIYGLNSGDKYYFRIKAIDRDGNYKERTISTTIHTSGSSSLTISSIEPMSSDNDLISATRAMIKWKTNLISKGVIYYGTSSNRLNDRVYVSPDRELNHEAQLESLIPGTTYYYKVRLIRVCITKVRLLI